MRREDEVDKGAADVSGGHDGQIGATGSVPARAFVLKLSSSVCRLRYAQKAIPNTTSTIPPRAKTFPMMSRMLPKAMFRMLKIASEFVCNESS